MDQSLTKKYGAHINYKVVNNAFKTIVPKVETWTMQFEVRSPYRFGDLKDVTVYQSKGAVDTVAIFPLETEEPQRDAQQPIVYELDADSAD